ncbi:hypothetical protein [Gemella cuniculi]|uniref:hypothetical protein n=1 Tax=Gemella cuniculi TaxID=150240 RepID=UPI000414C9CE|nr:hypothetical protein [Gemella cuniculi]
MKKLLENIIIISLNIIGIGMLIAKIEYAPIVLCITIFLSIYILNKRKLIK